MSTAQFNLQHAKYFRLDGKLQYFVSSRVTVLVTDRRAASVFQVCQLVFNRNGSIFVQFPYFRDVPGIVSRLEISVDSDFTSRVNLGQFGKVSSYAVKYSHPPDGNVHFSQDGKVLSQIRSKSFNLNEQEGRLFEAHAFHLSGFKTIVPGQEKKNRLYLPFQTDDMPSGIAVIGEWVRKSSYHAMATRNNGILGPLVPLRGSRANEAHNAFLIGQPARSPLQDHLLLLNVCSVPAVPGLAEPLLLFTGGWSTPDPQPRPGMTLVCLGFVYPCNDPEHFKRLIGTIDYDGANPASPGCGT